MMRLFVDLGVISQEQLMSSQGKITSTHRDIVRLMTTGTINVKTLHLFG